VPASCMYICLTDWIGTHGADTLAGQPSMACHKLACCCAGSTYPGNTVRATWCGLTNLTAHGMLFVPHDLGSKSTDDASRFQLAASASIYNASAELQPVYQSECRGRNFALHFPGVWPCRTESDAQHTETTVSISYTT
jgi:hypothetical protein